MVSDWCKTPPEFSGFCWIRSEAEERVVHLAYGICGLQISVPGLKDDETDVLILEQMEWRGPLEKPKAWTSGEPTVPGWYWVEGPKRIATVVHLYCPPAGDALWVAANGERDQPLVGAGLGGCVWAGPLGE